MESIRNQNWLKTINQLFRVEFTRILIACTKKCSLSNHFIRKKMRKSQILGKWSANYVDKPLLWRQWTKSNECINWNLQFVSKLFDFTPDFIHSAIRNPHTYFDRSIKSNARKAHKHHRAKIVWDWRLECKECGTYMGAIFQCSQENERTNEHNPHIVICSAPISHRKRHIAYDVNGFYFPDISHSRTETPNFEPEINWNKSWNFISYEFSRFLIEFCICECWYCRTPCDTNEINLTGYWMPAKWIPSMNVNCNMISNKRTAH